jgi:DNA-binding MarR family transcriptional regulator
VEVALAIEVAGPVEVREDADVDEDLLRALGDEVLRLHGRRHTALAGGLLESSAFRILWRLEERGPLTQRELADDLHLEQSTINRQVNSAIRQGFVEREAAPGRGASPIRPTQAGRDAYLHDGRLRADLIARAIEDLGAQRTRDMVASLRAFNDAVDRVDNQA